MPTKVGIGASLPFEGGPPLPVKPVNTVAPVISGLTTVGSTLTTTNGTWTGFPVPTFTYQWQRNGVAIGGATASTYVLIVADQTTTVTCLVTATNTGGVTSQVSNGLAIP